MSSEKAQRSEQGIQSILSGVFKKKKKIKIVYTGWQVFIYCYIIRLYLTKLYAKKWKEHKM